MSDRSLQRAVAVVAILLLAVVAAGSVVGSRTVAVDLSHRAQDALAAAGLDDVRVDFRGREAIVTGGNDVEARLASGVVAALPGVRQVDPVADQDRPIPGVARFEIDRAGDDVQISGAVPSSDDAADIKIAAATTMLVTVAGDVTVDRSVDAAPWASALPGVLRIVAGIAGLELEIPGDGTVRLGGRIADAATRDRVAGRVAERLPDLRLVDSLVVDPSRAGA